MVDPTGGDRRRAAWNTLLVWCARYACGRISRETALGLLCPLMILCFVVGTGLAVAAFPASYDFRYRWASTLASAHRNPSGYLFFGAWLSAVAVLLIPLPGYLDRQVRAPRMARRTGVLLIWLGIAGIFLMGLQTTLFPNLSFWKSAHRILAAATTVGLTTGFFSFAALAASRATATQSNRWPALLSCAILSAPVIGGALTYLLVKLWAIPRDWRIETPFLLRLTFWEWITVLGLFAGGYLTVWAASPRRRDAVIERATADRLQAGADMTSTQPARGRWDSPTPGPCHEDRA